MSSYSARSARAVRKLREPAPLDFEAEPRVLRGADLAYVAFPSDKITETVEVAGGIYCDLDSAGEVMGVEIFNYSRYEDSAGDNALGILKRLPSIWLVPIILQFYAP